MISAIDTVLSRWFVYMLLASDGQIYTGITTDIRRRWQEHAKGKAGARYFRGRQPAMLCLLDVADDRASASRREAAIKKLTRPQKNQLIASAAANTRLLCESIGPLPFPVTASGAIEGHAIAIDKINGKQDAT